jgi:hypothetical protein
MTKQKSGPSSSCAETSSLPSRRARGTAVVRYASAPQASAPQASEPHEFFHEGSYLGADGRVIEERHARIEELDDHKAVSAWRRFYANNPEYASAPRGVAVEEAAATVASGDYAKLGLSDDEAADYLTKWFASYIEKNGQRSVAEFRRQREQVKQIIEEARARYSAEAERKAAGARPADRGLRDLPEEPGGIEGIPEEPAGEAGRAGEVKARALPSTLREQGLRAADEMYLTYANKAALLDGKKLLEKHGFDTAEAILKSGQSLGAEHVALSKMMQRALLNEAFSVAGTDPEQAASLRQHSQDLASTLAAAFTKGGQFIQAAQLLDNSVEDVMATAAKIAKERGRELTDQEAERIHEAGEELESASADLEAAGAEVVDARERVEGSRKLMGWAEEGALTLAEIDTLRKRLESLRGKTKNREERLRELDGLIPPRARRPQKSAVRKRAVEILGVDEDALAAEIRSALSAAGPLKMARPEESRIDWSIPPPEERARAPRSLDDETIEKLARFGALKLLRADRTKYGVADFKREMVKEFGQAVRADLDRIHAEAYAKMRATLKQARSERTLQMIAERPGNEDLSRGQIEEIADQEERERRMAQLARAEHDKAARAYQQGRQQGAQPAIPKGLAEAIGRHAGNDLEAIAAGKLSRGLTPEAFAAEMTAEHGLKPEQAKALYLKAGQLLKDARGELNDARQMKAALKDVIAETEEERDRALVNLLQKRAARAQAQAAVTSQLKRLRQSRVERLAARLNRETKGTSIALMASGDLSSFRQAGAALAMHPSLAPEFATSLFKNISDTGHAKQIERIESDGKFTLSQRSGVDYAFAGKADGGEEFFEGAAILQRLPGSSRPPGTWSKSRTRPSAARSTGCVSGSSSCSRTTCAPASLLACSGAKASRSARVRRAIRPSAGSSTL